MRFADSLEQDIAAIKLFIDEVPAFLGDRTAAAAGAGDIHTRDAYRMAQTIALESCVHLLNSMVDGALLILANRTRAAHVIGVDVGRSRETLEKEIEVHLELELNTLTGWDQVDKIRCDANALKHRVGLTFKPGTDAPLTITDDVNVNQAELLECLTGVRAWLLEIDRRLSK